MKNYKILPEEKKELNFYGKMPAELYKIDVSKL